MNSKTNYGLEEAGMAQMDDSIGALLKHLEDIGEADNTIVVFTTDNGAEVVHLAGRRHDAVQGHQGHRLWKAASACRASSAGRARSSRARSRTASSPASTGSPRLCAAAGNPNITDQLLKGVKLGDRDLQEPSRWLQPDGPAARARGRPSATSSSTSAGPSWAPFASMTSSSSSTSSRKAGPGPKVTTDMPDHGQHPPGSVRADADRSAAKA